MSTSTVQPLLSGRHLVLGVTDMAPYVLVKRISDINVEVDGFVPQIVAWLAKKYNFTYEYVKSIDTAYGAFVNGSWNGLVGMIVRGEIDMAATSLTVTYPRSLVVDFTIPYSEDPMALLMPFPQLSSNINGIVKPFQYKVWIGIVVSLLIASVSLFIISKVESNKILHRRKKMGWFAQFWFLFRVIANPNEVISFTLIQRIIVASWCLVGIVIVNSYTSSVVSYLMAPKLVPLINTVQDLADSNRLKIVVIKDTSVDSALASATSGALAKLGEKLRAHPENILRSTEDVENKVLFQEKLFPAEHTSLKITIYNDFKKTNLCRLAIAQEPLLDNRLALALPKSSSLTNIVNKQFNFDMIAMNTALPRLLIFSSSRLIILRQMGLLNRWANSYLPKPNRCSVKLLSSGRPSKSNRSLTLSYLLSAFLLYGAGVVASLLAFLLEIIISIRR